MGWLGTTIDMAASKATVGDFFRHQRDGYKAIHVIRRSNQYGLYLEVSEFHSGSRKGVIRIPAGVEKQGWAQFSVFCIGHQNLAQKSTNERRRNVDKAAVMSKESEGGKPQILHQDFVFQNHASDPGKKAALISVDMPKDLVNSRVQFLLNLELGCGPEGEWFVSRAEIQKDESTRTHLTKQTNGPQSRPVTRQEWRPKVQPNNITHPVQDWELEMVESFMSLLYSQTIRPGVVDSLCWTPSCRGLFEVRSFYNTLISSHLPGIFP
jgi:hypothetical protein